MAQRTPVTLITGYLGSGKTTLLKTILQGTERKLAILMNEFGEIAIDSKIIEGKNVKIAELAGGCVCCSLAGEFEAAVEEILKVVKPEAIVVETTGVAEPDALIVNIRDSLPQVQLDAVVTVADADEISRFPEIGYTGRIQLEVADIILINKIDLVDSQQLDQVEGKIRELNATATFFKSSYCRMNTELLFGYEIEKHLPHREHSHPEIECFSFSSDKVLRREGFEEIACNLPVEVYRAKGFVRFIDDSYLFNYVAGRWDMEEFKADRTQLVFIGSNVLKVKNEILMQLKRCEV
jgi:G3E family GTPase